ncbi:MAG: insulinase family protein [Spirochaetes bacterium]|nr:insulinase family protein [Spirochaetota bacterium]
MKGSVLFVLIFLFAASFARAAPGPVTLENGVRVVLSENPSTSLAAVCIMMEGGTDGEKPDERGTYGLLSDLILSGTESRTKSDITRELSLLGDSVETYATPGYWAVEGTVPQASLEDFLGLLCDILFFPSLPIEELEKTKRTKIQSLRAETDSPNRLLSDLYREVFYPDLHVSRETRIRNIESVSISHLRSVHDIYFRPDGTVVSIAGALSKEEALEMTERVFGVLPKPPERLQKDNNEHRDAPLPFYRSAGGGVTQAGILVGSRLSGFDRSNEHLLQLACAVLDNSLGGRLFVELREKTGLVYGVHTGYSLEVRPFTLYAVSTSRKKNIKAVEKKTVDVLRMLVRKPPDARELLLAKEYLKTAVNTNACLPVYEARYNARKLVFGEPLRSLDERMRMIDSVTEEELASFIEECFPSRWTTLVVR